MEESQKNIEIITKTIVCGIIYIVLSLMIMFFVGIYKVEAKSYTWAYPEAISFSTNNTINTGLLKTCNNTNQCNYNDGNFVADYIHYRYYVGGNTANDDSRVKPDKYEVTFRMRIVGIDTLTSDNLKVRLMYYPNNYDNYGVAACDGAETTQIIYNNNTEEDVYVEYKCEMLNVTTDFSHFGIVIGSTPNTLYFTQVSQNLSFRGPELTEEDIINNNNANADKIVQNQDKNTNSIINNQNENTEEIKDAIKGEGLDTETKKPANKDKYNATHEKEEDLIEEWKPTDEELENINLEIEQEPAEYIWGLLERILNTNERILYLVMSILVIGVIKLIMGR